MKCETRKARALCDTLLNSQKSMKKSDRLLINSLGLMVEIYNSYGWQEDADRYLIPALQVACLKTTCLTKIQLFRTVAVHFAKGYYKTKQCLWLRPEYDIKRRAIDWFRMALSAPICCGSSDSQTLLTSLLFADFLIQSRGYQEGIFRLEPRKVPLGDRLEAKNLIDFVEAGLMNSSVSTRQQALFLVTKFDYGICCTNYTLSLTVHQQGTELGTGLFSDLLHSWFPSDEFPMPKVEDVQASQGFAPASHKVPFQGHQKSVEVNNSLFCGLLCPWFQDGESPLPRVKGAQQGFSSRGCDNGLAIYGNPDTDSDSKCRCCHCCISWLGGKYM